MRHPSEESSKGYRDAGDYHSECTMPVWITSVRVRNEERAVGRGWTSKSQVCGFTHGKRKQHPGCIAESHVRRHLAWVEGGQDLPECPPTAVLTGLRRSVSTSVCAGLGSVHVQGRRGFLCWPIVLDTKGVSRRVGDAKLLKNRFLRLFRINGLGG